MRRDRRRSARLVAGDGDARACARQRSSSRWLVVGRGRACACRCDTSRPTGDRATATQGLIRCRDRRWYAGCPRPKQVEQREAHPAATISLRLVAAGRKLRGPTPQVPARAGRESSNPRLMGRPLDVDQRRRLQTPDNDARMKGGCACVSRDARRDARPRRRSTGHCLAGARRRDAFPSRSNPPRSATAPGCSGARLRSKSRVLSP